MGPFCRRGAKTTRKSSRKRTLSKNQFKKSNNHESPILPPVNSPVKASNYLEDAETCLSSPCSTPKAERFRIPEIKTCPPAPKKRRVITSCSLRRTSISFFTPPDIDLFFNMALFAMVGGGKATRFAGYYMSYVRQETSSSSEHFGIQKPVDDVMAVRL